MNKEYYGTFPKLASFEIRNYESSSALYEGDADVMLCFGDSVIQYAKRSGYNVCEYTDGVLACLLPSKNTDIACRKYIHSALDRRLLVNAVVAGGGTEKLFPLAEGTYYRKHGDPIPQEIIGTKPKTVKVS